MDTLGKVVSIHGIHEAEVTGIDFVISGSGLDANAWEVHDKAGVGLYWRITRQRSASVCNHPAKKLFQLFTDQRGLQ